MVAAATTIDPYAPEELYTHVACGAILAASHEGLCLLAARAAGVERCVRWAGAHLGLRVRLAEGAPPFCARQTGPYLWCCWAWPCASGGGGIGQRCINGSNDNIAGHNANNKGRIVVVVSALLPAGHDFWAV